MRILFICGSLAPGRDGVGDYTVQLAEECRRNGHDCAIISLNESGETAFVDRGLGLINCLRLPGSLPWTERASRAASFRSRFAPHWVSWQLVSYGLDQRGLIPAQVREHAIEIAGPHCHVMLHELWLGLETSSSLKARALGWLQRRGLLGLLAALRPSCIDTSNATYQAVLEQERVRAGVLPLFGNIPIAELNTGPRAALEPWVALRDRSHDLHRLVAVTFGTLHPQWNAHSTARWLKESADRRHQQAAVLAIGRLGHHFSGVFAAFRRLEIPVTATGDLPATTISEILQSADFGIAAHPWALVGKSGAVAAMLDHGLPVVVPRDDWHYRGALRPLASTPNPSLARLDQMNPEHTGVWLDAKRPAWPTLPRVTRAFLSRLTACKTTAFSR